MTQPDHFESEARAVFDADLSLRQGTVFFEPLTIRHGRWGTEMPLIYEDVQSQLESVAESFGVAIPPDDPMTAKNQLRSMLSWSQKEGYTIVLIWTQMEDTGSEQGEPCIPGLVALFTDWPEGCKGIRDSTPFGARMVHGIFASYDVIGDLWTVRDAAENLGNPSFDPNVSIQYPACA